MSAPEYDVVVVGAGATGVHVAAELERLAPESKVIVLEATDTIGGRVRSEHVDLGDRGVHADLGAHYFGGRHRRLAALADRFAPGERFNNLHAFGDDPGCRARLDGRWRLTTRSSVYFDIHGLTKHSSPSDAVAIFRSLALFLGLEKLVDVEAPWKTPFARELDAISFQEWIDAQRLPKWIVEMWQIASLGIISTHARDISMLWFLWYNAANFGLMTTSNDYEGCPQEFSLEGGLGPLLERYARSLRSELRTNSPVASIEHGARDRVRVTLRSGETIDARRVVVAVTPRAVGKNIAFTPALSDLRRELLAQPMGHAVKAVCYYREPWWWNAHGGIHFNSFMTAPEDNTIEWALDTSCERKGIYSLMMFVSDRLSERCDRRDPEATKRAVLEAAVEVTGDPRAREVIGFAFYDWRDQPFVGGGPNTVMRPGLLSKLEGVLGEPEGPHARLHFASAEQSNEFTGYVEGALACAERVAERLAETLRDERAGREPRPRQRPARVSGAPGSPVRGTSGLASLALGAGWAALTPAWLARPVLDRAYKLIRRQD